MAGHSRMGCNKIDNLGGDLERLNRAQAQSFQTGDF